MIEMRSWIRRIKNNSWRWQLRKRRIIRWFQYFDWKNDLPNFRWLVLLCVVGISVILIDALFCWVTDCGYGWFDFTATKMLLAKVAQANTPSAATVLLALYSAPAAYIIWWFRDANNRQQIESQRKDINLKDFHRLAEWAAGMHLPEDKVVESRKEIEVIKAKTKKFKIPSNTKEDKNNNTIETNRGIESFAAPSNHILHTPSRRDGAASLQIAAIYQLQAFLQGDYGKQFQRPAFQLLKSIWLVLVTPHLEALGALMEQERDFTIAEKRKNFKTAIELWHSELTTTMSKPIGQSINVALGVQQGRVLRKHAVDLPNAIFAGYNSRLAALMQPLELNSLSLQGVQLQGANLRWAQLQGTNLSEAQLQGTNLWGVQLQGADLRWAQLQGAILWGAQLQEANLAGAQLQGADLEGSQLQGARLGGAILQGTRLVLAQLQEANLEGTQLQGANLSWAQLQGAFLVNTGIEQTKFLEANTDDNTQVFIADKCDGVFPKNWVIKSIETFFYREKLRNENGLVLPDILYKQLFAKPTEYTVSKSNGEEEKKFGVGLRDEF
ncbi:Pentapeptide repeat protein (fragment) [Crenothrix polyspora]|uniref:Pentapeptide repeat protein n=1 Tax=Crenothrix polyspora TaxID=360316 RepID=A0A1R4H673_9GAMM